MIRVLENKDYKITQKFGVTNINGNKHLGVDVVCVDRKPCNILAHSKGVVEKLVTDYKTKDSTGGSYGNYVLLKHPTGAYTMYAHLKYGSVCVKLGQEVEKGQVLGVMGDTGLATDVHLHFETRDMYGTKVDPEIYLENPLPDLPDEEVIEGQEIGQMGNAGVNTSDSLHFDIFEVGDKVSVTGRAYETPKGTGKRTAEYNGEQRYITKIEKDAKRPYHISAGQTLGDRDKGWVSAEQIKKVY